MTPYDDIGTYLHPRSDDPIKKQKIFHKIPWWTCPEGSKIQAWYFRQWNCLPKEIRLCDEIEAFKRNLKTHLFVRFVNESTLAIWFWRIFVKCPRILSTQFMALYKPCKPKPIELDRHWLRWWRVVWQHQVPGTKSYTWTDVDLSSVVFCGIHLRAIS